MTFSRSQTCCLLIIMIFGLLSADDNDVMFTEEIIRPVLAAMKVG